VRVRRLVLLAVCVLLAGLFVAPVRAYRSSQEHLAGSHAELRAAQVERDRLLARKAELATRPALVREARRQGYIFPGETPFAVEAP
jgi:cell division protein FtsB